MMKQFVTIMLVLMNIVFTGNSFADPFISYPGTRAKSLGGAYSAAPYDASAIWYNPAGIVFGETGFVFEYSQGISIDTDTSVADIGESIFDQSNIQTGMKTGLLGNEAHKFFVGYLNSNQNKYGWALGVYSPYTIEWSFSPYPLEEGKGYGEIIEEMYVLGLAFSFKPFKQLSLGACVEGIYEQYDDSKIWYFDKSDEFINMGITRYFAREIKELDDSIGISGTFGFSIPYTFQRTGIRVQFGGVYRLKSNNKPELPENIDDTTIAPDIYERQKKAAEQLFFGKPSSWAIGFRYSQVLIQPNEKNDKFNVLLGLSTQYGVTDWSTTNDQFDNMYQKLSLGAELSLIELPLFSSVRLLKKVIVRGGYYNSQATEKSEGWPDVQGVTFGGGLKPYPSVNINATYEHRFMKFEQSDNKDISLLSLSLVFYTGP
jgi:hypothetical protein